MFALGLEDIMARLPDDTVELRQHRLVLLDGDVDVALRLGHVEEEIAHHRLGVGVFDIHVVRRLR